MKMSRSSRIVASSRARVKCSWAVHLNQQIDRGARHFDLRRYSKGPLRFTLNQPMRSATAAYSWSDSTISSSSLKAAQKSPAETCECSSTSLLTKRMNISSPLTTRSFRRITIEVPFKLSLKNWLREKESNLHL